MPRASGLRSQLGEHVRQVVGLVLPAQPGRTKTCGMHIVMAARSPAVVVRRVEIAARIPIAREGEFEVEPAVAGHQVALKRRGMLSHGRSQFYKRLPRSWPPPQVLASDGSRAGALLPSA